MNEAQETVLEVQGMTCGSCVRHVTAALDRVDGVEHIDVRLKERLVIVRHDAAAAPIAQLVEVLGEEGYPAKARAA